MRDLRVVIIPPLMELLVLSWWFLRLMTYKVISGCVFLCPLALMVVAIFAIASWLEGKFPDTTLGRTAMGVALVGLNAAWAGCYLLRERLRKRWRDVA